MLMIADAIGLYILVYFGERKFDRGFSSRAAHTGHGIDDDRICLDQSFNKQGSKRKNGTRRVAARIRNEARLLNRLCIPLWQTVNGIGQNRAGSLRAFVKFFVKRGILQPVIATQVNDNFALIEKRWRKLHRLAMRQRE